MGFVYRAWGIVRAKLVAPRTRKRLWSTLLSLLTIVLLLILAFPYYWLVVTTLKPPQEQFQRVPRLIPRTWTLENYRWALGQKDYMRALQNSVVVAVATAVVATVLNSFAAYSLSRYRYRAKSAIVAFLMSTQMMSGVITIVSCVNDTGVALFASTLAIGRSCG